MRKVLVTGSDSGLGRYLRDRFDAQGFRRGDRVEDLADQAFDTVIHCAFNSSREIDAEKLPAYLDDNALLTERLTRLSAGKFVFFSTVDLYPSGGGPHHPDGVIHADDLKGPYQFCKLLSEGYVVQNCGDHLILRTTMPLGRWSRRNTLVRVLTEKSARVGLRADARYNVISHVSVGDFIEKCVGDGISGCFNLASTGDALLADIARWRGHEIEFGQIPYCVANVDNGPAAALLPAFLSSTSETLAAIVAGGELPLTV